MENRDPLAKEKLFGGTRQVWALIFIVCGFVVMTVTVLVAGFDPVPFMQFFLAIGSIFIAGASGDSWVKAYKVGSLRETEVIEETKRERIALKQDDTPDPEIIVEKQQAHSTDPSYAPLAWVEEQGK